MKNLMNLGKFNNSENSFSLKFHSEAERSSEWKCRIQDTRFEFEILNIQLIPFNCYSSLSAHSSRALNWCHMSFIHSMLYTTDGSNIHFIPVVIWHLHPSNNKRRIHHTSYESCFIFCPLVSLIIFHFSLIIISAY